MLMTISFLVSPLEVYAGTEVLGIHILEPGEVTLAQKLLANGDDKDKFVTIPFTVLDIGETERWQPFFDECHTLKIRPIIRLATRVKDGAWTIPAREEIGEMITFLSSLEWHRPELTVITFNEPNHAKEWGNSINPEEYAHLSMFAVNWMRTEAKTYTILPAGMDLDASNASGTMEAFSYLRRVFAAEPDLASAYDAWNSHSYPNPGFNANPNRIGKNSLRGFENELAFLHSYTQREYDVYITETGWDSQKVPTKYINSYFQTAFKKIWGKDPRIRAVTPFVLRGSPGVFAPFSFLDDRSNPTALYRAYRNILTLSR